MAGRGMLFAEGPTACPFVALESDRDRRSNEPDPRHRCYAEPTPAPRALAHQRQYCLSPGFGGCAIFQDWAIRAAARPVPLRPIPDTGPAVAAQPADGDPIERVPSLPPADESPGRTVEDEPAEIPQPVAPADEPVAPAGQPVAPGGDPVASADAPSHDTSPPEERPRRRWSEDWPPAAGTAEGGLAAAAASAAGTGDTPARRVDYAPPPAAVAGSQPARPPSREAWAAQRADLIPPWERERYAAYPTIRTRIGMGDAGSLLQRLTRLFAAIAGIAVVIALLILLPGLLPAGAPAATTPAMTSPTPTAGPTAQPTPSPTPEPTPERYTIQAGDTLFAIASRHGLTIEQLMAANPQISDPNLIQVGQVIVIPPVDFVPPAPQTPAPGG